MTRKKASSTKERVRKFRQRKRAQGYKQGWVLFKGLEKIGTQKTKRKARMIPQKTWKHTSAGKKRGNKIRGSF